MSWFYRPYPYTTGGRPIDWTPEMDAELASLATELPSVSAIARAMGLGWQVIKNRAQKLKIELPRTRIDWTPGMDAELARLAIEKSSVAPIARAMGLAPDTIERRAEELRIELPRKSERPSRKELAEMYQEFSGPELAELYGVHVTTIYNWLAHYKIPRRSKARSRPSREELARLFAELGTTKTAEKLGIANKTLHKWLDRYGIPRETIPLRPEPPPREELARLYKKFGGTRAAEELGIAISALYGWLKQYKIPLIAPPSAPPVRPPREELARQYQELGIVETAKELGISRTTLYEWLDRYGIPRTHSKPNWLSFEEARDFVRQQGLLSWDDWRRWVATERPSNIPATPWKTYKGQWLGMTDWLEYPPTEESIVPLQMRRAIKRKMREKHPTIASMLSYAQAKKMIQSIANEEDWKSFTDVYEWLRSEDRPEYFPRDPQEFYADWWKGWVDFVGPDLAPPSQTRGRTVGARPWQILHPSEPAPEYDPELELPIDIDVVHYRRPVTVFQFNALWESLSKAEKRIAAVVALDMAAGDVIRFGFFTDEARERFDQGGSEVILQLTRYIEGLRDRVTENPHRATFNSEEISTFWVRNPEVFLLPDEDVARQPYASLRHALTLFIEEQNLERTILQSLATFDCHGPYGPLEYTEHLPLDPVSRTSYRVEEWPPVLQEQGWEPAGEWLTDCLEPWINIWWQEVLDTLAFVIPKAKGRIFRA